MRKHDLIISYDIADPKRLKKVAKLLEGVGMRFQYSLFVLYEVDKNALEPLIRKLTQIINDAEDDVRIYRVRDFGIAWGKAVDLREPFVIL